MNCLFAHPAPRLSVGDQEAQTERMEAWGRQKKHHVSSPNKNRKAPIRSKCESAAVVVVLAHLKLQLPAHERSRDRVFL